MLSMQTAFTCNFKPCRANCRRETRHKTNGRFVVVWNKGESVRLPYNFRSISMVLYFYQEQRNSLFLKKDCNRPIFKILIMTNTRCDVIRHLIKKAYFSPFLKLLLRNYSTSTNSYYQGWLRRQRFNLPSVVWGDLFCGRKHFNSPRTPNKPSIKRNLGHYFWQQLIDIN